MTALLLAALVLGSPDYDLSYRGGLPLSGGTLTGTVRLDCTTSPCQIISTSPTSDVAPRPIMVHAANSYPAATGANLVGARLMLNPGIGARTITVTDYTKLVGGNDTVVMTVTVSGANPVATTLTATVTFACITSNNACATALAAAIDALAGVSSTATGAVVSIVPDETCLAITGPTIADGGVDGAFATATISTDGKVLIPSATATTGGLCFANDTSQDTCIVRGGENIFSVLVGGVAGGNFSTAYWQLPSTHILYFGARTQITSGADGYLTLKNNAGTAFVGLQFGGAAATQPMLKVNGAGLEAKLADDSLYTIFRASQLIGGTEADLSAGACTAGLWITDTGGATRELCHCNAAGSAYDCVSVTTANGPTD